MIEPIAFPLFLRPLDEAQFAQVRAAFTRAFPQLAVATPVIDEPDTANGCRSGELQPRRVIVVTTIGNRPTHARI